MNVIIYHNPRCSKSRQALEIIKEKNITPQIVEYLKTPLNRPDLMNLLNLLNKKPSEIIRKKEAKELSIDDPNIDDETIIDAILENPALMERPIVVSNNGARIGRPPESILEIL